LPQFPPGTVTLMIEKTSFLASSDIAVSSSLCLLCLSVME
jgi:hypothetical protein